MDRKTLPQILLALSLLAFSCLARADLAITVEGTGSQTLPVAILPFVGEDQLANRALTPLVGADLARSGLFTLTDTRGTKPVAEPAQLDYADWQKRGANAVVIGSVSREGERYLVRFRLMDVARQEQLAGFVYPMSEAQYRQVAHQIADVIYEQFAGVPGIFGTRIAYVTKQAKRYELHIADADGQNAQMLLRSAEPIMSPSWAPDGNRIAYVSFEQQKPVVYVQNIRTGRRLAVANFKGSNSAPAWSPDGNRLAVVLTQDGSSQIYLIDAEGGKPTRLTSSYGIDTEPAFSPDGGWIYFTSDRGGSPQIYKIPSRGGEAQRVTFEGHYNVSPRVSPDGKTLAFIRNEGGAFRVVAQDLESGVSNILGSTGDDESPSFAPNGRYILYATRVGRQKILAAVSTDGRIRQRLATLSGDVREPAWGPWPQRRNP